MGQVPENILIVGDGFMARHMARYFDFKNIPYNRWSRRGIFSGVSLREAAAQCRVVLVLISDRAIEEFVAANSCLNEKTVIHFSGSLVTRLAFGMHPLMTFSEKLYDLAEYEKIPFVAERGGALFHEIFPSLINPVFEIDKSQKALYHALCVMSGNFTTILWAKALREMSEKFGIPSEAVRPFAEQTLKNVFESGIAALTGPFSRGDGVTVEKNLAALDGDPFRDVYMAFQRAYRMSQRVEVTN